MDQRENITFYFRLLFLPLSVVLSLARAWLSSWRSLEAIHQRQEERFQRMWALLPTDVQETVTADQADKIEDHAVRRFARMLGDYRALGPRIDSARELASKTHYLNALDAAHRRLRIAEAREWAAWEALGGPPG